MGVLIRQERGKLTWDGSWEEIQTKGPMENGRNAQIRTREDQRRILWICSNFCVMRGEKVRTRILCMEQPSRPSWLSAVYLLIAGIWRHWKPPALLQEWISESLTSVEVMFLKLFRKCQKSLWLLFIGHSKERLYLERNWNKLPPNLLNH